MFNQALAASEAPSWVFTVTPGILQISCIDFVTKVAQSRAMTARSRRNLLGFAIFPILTLTLTAKDPKIPLTITVHVYNYANLDRGTLRRATREAARIYHQVGVNTEWVDCPRTSEEADKYPACIQPTSPTRLTLRVISRQMAEHFRFSKETFGRSWLPEAGGFGYVAAVSAHHADTLARKIRFTEGAILGHLIAHELGHLLLGANSHARTGIMHVPWRSKELKFVQQGTMYFDSIQAKQIRAGVRQRIAADGLTRSRTIY